MNPENPQGAEKPRGNRPVHEIVDGLLKVTIWQNEGDRGPWYQVTPRRRYKDGEEWKDSNSYDGDDALRLSKLLDLAHSWILAQEQQQRAQRTAA